MSLKAPSEYVFIMRQPCGCVTAILADQPTNKNYVAMQLASYIVDGYTIERVKSDDGVRLMQWSGCIHKTTPEVQQQAELFADHD